MMAAARLRARREAGPADGRRARPVALQVQLAGGGFERRPVLGTKPAAEAVALLAGEHDDQPGGRFGRLAGCEDDLRYAPASRAAEVHPGLAGELDQLGPADFLERLVDGQLTSPQSCEHPPHFAIIRPE